MKSLVHTTSAISDILCRGLTPITDNEGALIELGFTRSYPQVRRGYDAMIWERTVDYSSPGKPRKFAIQRAFLDHRQNH
jgi:hypothetical protein